MKVAYIVFYGTLSSKGGATIRHKIIRQLEYVGACKFPGQLYDLGRYPGLKNGDRKIVGELYKILDSSVLDVLDAYEAVGNDDPTRPGFTRRLTTLIEPRQKAWVYYYDGEVESLQLLEDNPWV